MIDPIHLVGTVLPRMARRFYPDLLWRMPTTEPVLYLTFDDGPTSSLTKSLLQILDSYEAKATFFLIGRYAERFPNLVHAMVAAGHTLGNHTYSHMEAWAHRSPAMLRDLELGAGAIEAITKQRIRLMRPPWGQFTTAMRYWCQVRRQRLTMWDVGPGDFLPGATALNVERRILRSVRPGAIIVLHDNPLAADVLRIALPRVLEMLSGAGWQFRAL